LDAASQLSDKHGLDPDVAVYVVREQMMLEGTYTQRLQYCAWENAQLIGALRDYQIPEKTTYQFPVPRSANQIEVRARLCLHRICKL
jgi:hypothetical protein